MHAFLCGPLSWGWRLAIHASLRGGPLNSLRGRAHEIDAGLNPKFAAGLGP